MKHIQTILQIIENGISNNADGVRAFSLLLAQQMEEDGSISEAAALRARVIKPAVQPLASASDHAAKNETPEVTIDPIKLANRLKNEEEFKNKRVRMGLLAKALKDFLAKSPTFSTPLNINGVLCFRPLAINTNAEILKWIYQQPITKDFSNLLIKQTLQQIIGQHVRQRTYLLGLEKIQNRFDLNGNIVGDVAPEHKVSAARRERFCK